MAKSRVKVRFLVSVMYEYVKVVPCKYENLCIIDFDAKMRLSETDYLGKINALCKIEESYKSDACFLLAVPI